MIFTSWRHSRCQVSVVYRADSSFFDGIENVSIKHSHLFCLAHAFYNAAFDIPDDVLTAIADALALQPRLRRLKLELYDESRQVKAVLSLLEAKPALVFSTGFARCDEPYLSVPDVIITIRITFSTRSQLAQFMASNLPPYNISGVQTTFGILILVLND